MRRLPPAPGRAQRTSCPSGTQRPEGPGCPEGVSLSLAERGWRDGPAGVCGRLVCRLPARPDAGHHAAGFQGKCGGSTSLIWGRWDVGPVRPVVHLQPLVRGGPNRLPERRVRTSWRRPWGRERRASASRRAPGPSPPAWAGRGQGHGTASSGPTGALPTRANGTGRPLVEDWAGPRAQPSPTRRGNATGGHLRVGGQGPRAWG